MFSKKKLTKEKQKLIKINERKDMKKVKKIILFVLIIFTILTSVNVLVLCKTNKVIEEYNEVQLKQTNAPRKEVKRKEIKQEIEMSIMDIVEVKRNEYAEKVEALQSIEDEQERFIAYKKLYDEYLEWADLPETIYDCYSEEEILLIQKVVETETFDCDFNSKANIALVVLNRVNSEEFGNTITEVVTAKNQFAYGRDNISESTVLAVEYAFLNYDKTHGALYFHSGKKTNTFNKKQYKFTDDAGHHFY